MGDPNLESAQARWAQECCAGGTCPVCNPSDENDEEYRFVPECDNCGNIKHMERNSSYDWFCASCGWSEEMDKDVPKEVEDDGR